MSPIFSPIKATLKVQFSASDGTEQVVEQKFVDLSEGHACMWAINRILLPRSLKNEDA